QENYIEAIVAYRRLTEIAPQDPKAYYNLGLALKGRDRTTEAIAAIEKARDLYKRQGNSQGVRQAESLLRELK
ncbi:MAG TPA: Tfp pilus assembly protein PilF, partial [Cyanobacteria bacterium UBA11166]|nr:Tfp pilus assembly protein PilF [Cyanobacteria bacterium UBA11166]